MKKNEVKIGSVYTARVTDRLVPVRIDCANRHGGWSGTKLATKKTVRIKSAQRLRGKYIPPGKAAAPEDPKPGDTAKPTKADSGMVTSSVPPKAATVDENAKPVCPNCGSTEVDEDGDCAKCCEPNGAAGEELPKASSGATNARRTAASSTTAKKPTTATTTPTGAKEPKQGTNEAKPKKAATQAKQGDQKAKRLSGLDAAVRVLAEAKQPMNVREIVKVAFDKDYWKSDGRTPHATILFGHTPRVQGQGESISLQEDRSRALRRQQVAPQATCPSHPRFAPGFFRLGAQ